MKGYFAKIASRLSGANTPRQVRPNRASLWTSQAETDIDDGRSNPVAPIAQWPDTFDGTPTENQPRNKKSIHKAAAQMHNQDVAPSTETFHLQPQSPREIHSPTQQIQQLNPQENAETFSPKKVESIHIVPPQNPPHQFEAAPIQPQIDLQQEPTEMLLPKSDPQARQMRELKSEEGLFSEMPLPSFQALQNSKLKLEPMQAPVPRPVEVEKRNKAEEKKQMVIQPELPKLQARSFPTKMQLQPQNNAHSAANTQRLRETPTKANLVIGKITVEVIEPARPNVVVEKAPQIQQKSMPAKSNRIGRGNNLKYGLGQI